MATLRSNELKKAGLLILADDLFVVEIFEGNNSIGVEIALVSIEGNTKLKIENSVEFAVPQGTTITKVVLEGVGKQTQITVDEDLFFQSNGIYVVNTFELNL